MSQNRIDSFLGMVVDQRASDLHLHAGNPPIVRYLGDLVPLPFRILTAQDTQSLLYDIIPSDAKVDFEKTLSCDFAYAVPGVGRFRVNVFQQSAGMGAVFRTIDEHVSTLDELRLPQILRDFCTPSSGIVLVTGPTGSGKSTTLAAMVDEINRGFGVHIITIEDPIEYVHAPMAAIITQRELHRHTQSTAMALRAALRESPDVIVVGEIRDYDTLSVALSAAETGVLVFGTLHTNSAAKAVDRLLSICPDDASAHVASSLAVLLRGVVAQRLVRLASGDGRVALLEILKQSYAVSNLIREAKTYQIDGYISGARETGGSRSIEASAFELIKVGMVNFEDALHVVNERESLTNMYETWKRERAM